MTIGDKVKEARMRKGLTQPELQERVKSANIWRIENDLMNPGAAVLIRIADALDMELGFMDKTNGR